MSNAAVSAKNAGPFGNNEDAIDANEVFFESTQRAIQATKPVSEEMGPPCTAKIWRSMAVKTPSCATKTPPKA